MNKIIFKPGWSAAPHGIVGTIDKNRKGKPGLLAELTVAEARLLFVLSDACKISSECRVSNLELMKATGLDDRSLRRARTSLADERKAISAIPADKRAESYAYSVRRAVRIPRKSSAQDASESIADSHPVPIPREKLFKPTIAGAKFADKRNR